MRKVFGLLPTVQPLHPDQLSTRSGASAGLWMVLLVPLACSPGLYSTYSHCLPTPRFLAVLAIQAGVCGIHLFRQLCVSSSQQKNAGEDGCHTSLVLKVLFQPYTPALATTAALALLTDIPVVVGLVCSLVCARLLYASTPWLLKTFPGSFSLGEGAVAGQAIALTTTTSLFNLVHTLANHAQLLHSQQISVFIQTAVLVLVSLVGSLQVRRLQSPRLLLPLVCAYGLGGLAVSSLLLGQWTPVWLLDVVTVPPTRLALLAWWALLTLFSVVLTLLASRRAGGATTVVRKVYHVVICLVFVPGILLEPTFTHLAATAATMICVLLELIRVQDIQPLSGLLSQAFAPFLDEKDGGKLILSHLYLLVGVSCPLWLYPCPVGEVEGQWGMVLPLLAGVLAVGVGDTAASVGGTYLGRRRWSGTKKTVEGSLCAVVAQLVAVGALVGAGVVQVSVPGWGRMLVSFVMVAVVEALTDQVDNVVLPLLLYTPLMDM